MTNLHTKRFGFFVFGCFAIFGALSSVLQNTLGLPLHSPWVFLFGGLLGGGIPLIIISVVLHQYRHGRHRWLRSDSSSPHA